MNKFNADKDGWFELVRKGLFDHPKGKQLIDDESVSSLLKNFSKETLVDYEHRSLLPGEKRDTTAGGWLREMKTVGDSVWVRSDWTTRGKTSLDNGEYRHHSPTLLGKRRADGVYHVIGLDSVALTNRPNMRALRPVVQLANAEESPGKDTYGETIFFNNSEDNTMDYKQTLIGLLGLAATATDADITTAVEKTREKIADINKVTTENTELKNSLTSMSGEILENDMKRFGHLFKDDTAKASMKKMLQNDRPGTITLLENMAAGIKTEEKPKVVPLFNSATSKPPSGAEVLKNSEADAAHASKVRARAHEIQQKEGVGFDTAWSRAEIELRA